ncbi:MAG: DUF1934 domain-containing protein [Clostridia bacterium]|nr:DUF1934 domain-containing protein [Clostridia bacterium]
MKDVIIKIKSTQGLGKETETVEFWAEGKINKEAEKVILSYLDNSIIKGAKVETVLTISGEESITLERSGEISSKLIIEKGVRNNCFYSVPEGSLTLGIYGKEIKNTLKDLTGNIKMIYTLDADMRPISENIVEISVLGR